MDATPEASAVFLLYGSYGYTGNLIARLAVERGVRPVLAGRNERAVAAQAWALGLRYRVFALDDPPAVDAGLAGLPVVLNCAGPFSRTARPVVDACIRTGAHYLDITGEVAVFEALAARDAEARAAGVLLLPGVGFDVVPSDCLAAHLVRRLPTATRLALAFRAGGRVSRGTALTVLEGVHRGGLIRRGGALERVPAAWKTRWIDFGAGPVEATTIPLGDVSTAYYSTGVGDVVAYVALPPAARRALALTRYVGWLLGLPPVRSLLRWSIRRGPRGPTPEERARGRSAIWGEALNDDGRRMVSRLHGPDAYTLTARTALAAAVRVAAGGVPAGFRTPSLVFGPEFILGIDGVTREDVE